MFAILTRKSAVRRTANNLALGTGIKYQSKSDRMRGVTTKNDRYFRVLDQNVVVPSSKLHELSLHRTIGGRVLAKKRSQQTDRTTDAKTVGRTVPIHWL